jgi:hypothetical protein
MNKLRVAALLAMSVLLVAGSAFAQNATTGAIVGKVAQGGTPLPGVTVEIKSPALQGTRTEVSDSSGQFRFTLLPPGIYSLSASLSGFNTVNQKDIQVGLNRTVTLDVAISPQVSEQITVISAAPVVDVTSAAGGVNVTSQTLQTLPVARNFTAAATLAPGVQSDATGATVYGSSGAENEYVIDGLNATGVNTGSNVKSVNVEFISETQTLTTGLPAEYGRMTGGVINAITKSGSNEFHGDGFGYTSGGSLLANPKYQADLPTTATTIGDTSQNYDFGANLGGYIMKDRLWFFGAYDRVKQTNQSIRINTPLVTPDGFTVPVGGKIPTDISRDLYAGKLSLALTSNQLIYGSIIGDPSKTDGAQFAISGPPSTFLGTNKTGGNDVVGRYSGVFGTRWNLNATVGKHKEKNELSGEGTQISQLTDLTVIPNTNTGGFRGFTNSEYNRDVYKADLSAFVGPHTFKLGLDNEKLKATVNRFLGGGDWVRKICNATLVNNQCPAGALIYYRHEVFLNDLAPGFDVSNPATWLTSIANPLTVSPKTDNTAWYAQDSWKVLSNFTVNAGVRWEEQKLFDRFGATKIDLKNNWAPRIGAIWDPANNGRSKVYVNFGRFFESIPMDINIRSFGGERSLDVNNFDPVGGHLTPDQAAPKFSATKKVCGPTGDQSCPYRILGSAITPVDPNLKAQYIDEYLAGYDYEIAPNFAVGIKGTYRNLGRVIEDMLYDPANGVYAVVNPGVGTGANTGDINGDPTLIPAPKPTRRYKGVELHAEKRFSNNYQFYASYVWSRLEGNYDGTFQASTGQLDPNINSAYDYADFEVNNAGGGLLSNDRTHQLKFYGSYTLPNGLAKGLTTGLGFHYASGTPLTAMGYASSYRNYEYYLTERGALGRGPADWEADIHGDYPIPVGSSRASIVLDVFNVFNRQAKNALDQRYNISPDACGGIPANLCNGDGGIAHIPGTVTPVGELTNPRATVANPNFLQKGTSFTGARSFRLGARFTF